MKTKIFATTDPVDEKCLENYIENLVSQKVKNIHFDVMDGKFVETKKLTPKTIINLSKKFEKVNFNAHLMTKNPVKYLSKLNGSKLGTVYAHIETFKNSNQVFDFFNLAVKLSFKAGIAISPNTQVKFIDETILKSCKNFLILGVIPGKSGQKLISATVKKVKELKKMSPKCSVAFDGGVNEKNIQKIIGEGVDEICLGSLMKKLVMHNEASAFLAQF